MGYKAFGPIIFGFSKWLHNSTKELNIDKIYFLSRDGFIIKKAYDMLFEKSNTYYMFASRRAFSVPNVYPNMQYKEVCDVLNLSRSITIETFKKKLGIEKICYNENELNNTKFSIDSNELKEFFHKNRDLIFCNAEKERKALVNYLREISFCGNVAIVDIGWFGNMQKSLEKICIDNVMDAKINGFYVGKRHGYKDNMRNGFLFDNCKNKDISIAIDSMNALFESCFLADHGSVRSYISNIEFFPCEYNNEDLLLIKDFQQGALRFVKDFSIFLPYVNLSSKDSFKIFFKEFCFPRKEIAIKFGNLTFYDYNLVNIAQPRNMYVYFKNPALFFSDFRYCNWKIGFLTRVFNFRWLWYPCYYVYRRLRNCIQ